MNIAGNGLIGTTENRNQPKIIKKNRDRISNLCYKINTIFVCVLFIHIHFQEKKYFRKKTAEITRFDGTKQD